MDRWEIIKQFRLLAPRQVFPEHERLLTAAADNLESDAREIGAMKAEIERLKEANKVLKEFVRRNK